MFRIQRWGLQNDVSWKAETFSRKLAAGDLRASEIQAAQTSTLRLHTRRKAGEQSPWQAEHRRQGQRFISADSARPLTQTATTQTPRGVSAGEGHRINTMKETASSNGIYFKVTVRLKVCHSEFSTVQLGASYGALGKSLKWAWLSHTQRLKQILRGFTGSK